MKEVLENEYISSQLQSMTAYDFFVRVLALIILISFIGGVAIFVYKLFEKYRVAKNLCEKKDDMIKDHQLDIEKLKESDVIMNKKIDDIGNKIDELSKIVFELKNFNDSNESAKLKDRIAQAYAYYHPRGQWTPMQKESMESLIKAYENYNDNSFVHEIVQKEMYTWKIVEDEGLN